MCRITYHHLHQQWRLDIHDELRFMMLMITVMIKLRCWGWRGGLWWWSCWWGGAGEGGGGWQWRWWWWWCEFYIKWQCKVMDDGNDDDVCLIAPPLFHIRSVGSFYMNINLNAISKIHQGIDGINLTKDFSYNMPDILTKQISTWKASNMRRPTIN